jgi:hypothetical protein
VKLKDIRTTLQRGSTGVTVRAEGGIYKARWTGKSVRHIDMHRESLELGVRRLPGAQVQWVGRLDLVRGGYGIPAVEVHFTMQEAKRGAE